MKNKDLLFSLLVAIAALLVLAGCEDSLGIEERVLKERLGVDTLITRDTIPYLDTLKVIVTDTIIVNKDSTVIHRDTIRRYDTIPYYEKMPEHIRAVVNCTFMEVYSGKSNLDDVAQMWKFFPRELIATVDTAYNGMKLNLKFNLENTGLSHKINDSISVREIVQSIQVNLRNLNPFYSGPELPCDGEASGRWSNVRLHFLDGGASDYDGVSTGMRIVFYGQKYDANFRLYSVKAKLSAEVPITGNLFTIHKIIGDIVFTWKN